MSITVYTYNDKVLKNAATDKWLKTAVVNPYNPLDLPPFTIRVRSSSTPSISGATVTPVTGQSGVYDVYKNSSNWDEMFYDNSITEVLGANTTGVTSMSRLFAECSSLSSVALFDTSDVINMDSMFEKCSSLTSVPLFNVSSATNVEYAFSRCNNVESGALAMYNQLSALGAQITDYDGCFTNCGSNTTSGAAELAQIPSSWGGTGT